MSTNPWVASLTGVAVGGPLGWLAGVAWYEILTPTSAGDLGTDLQGIETVFRGTVGGAVTGLLAGPPLRGVSSLRAAAAALVRSVATGCLFVVGLSYVGDLTNADGPGSNWSYVGFAALPVSIVLGVRLLRRAASGSSETALGKRHNPAGPA